MSSNSQSYFQPPPPIRTSTGGSQKSQSSGTMSPSSPTFSPTSSFARGSRSAASPAEETFLGAIAGRMRRGRSRSRSHAQGSRNRSRSPQRLPPDHLPPRANAQPTSPTYTSQRPEQPRHASSSSQASATASKPKRPTMPRPTRRTTSGSDMWRGRHSNEWLFNGFSVTGTAKDIFHIGRKS